MTTKSLAAGPLLMPQLDSLRNALGHGTGGGSSGCRREDGRPHEGMTANEPLSPKRLALAALGSSGTDPGLWREGPYFQGKL